MPAWILKQATDFYWQKGSKPMGMKNRILLRVSLAATMVLCGLPAMALQPFTAQYDASYKGIPANGVMLLVPQGNRWTYSVVINNSMAKLSQSTVFSETGNGFRPLGSSDRSQYLTKTKSVVSHYDWKNLQARWTGDIKPSRSGPVKMQNGDMDALLVNLALTRDATTGRPMNYRLVENGRIKPLQYRVIGKENMTVAGKPVLATKVAQSSGNKQTIVWIAPGIPTPLRIVQREDGSESFRLQLKSWR